MKRATAQRKNIFQILFNFKQQADYCKPHIRSDGQNNKLTFITNVSYLQKF